MNAQASPSPRARTLPLALIGTAIRRAVGRGAHQGNSGNCANFAVVLDRVLGAGGAFALVDSGEHYEYVNHVAVCFRGALFDCEGLRTEEDLLAQYCGAEEGDAEPEVLIERFEDPGDVRRLADDNAIFAIPLDETALERDLRDELDALSEGTAPAIP